MPLADLNSIIENNSLEYAVAEKVFKKITQAENMLRKWIGDTKYDEILVDTTHTYYDELKLAESLLCFAIALPRLNMYIREKGGLVKATGFNETRNQIMGKRELNAYQREIYHEARQQIRELILPSYYEDRPTYLSGRYVSS